MKYLPFNFSFYFLRVLIVIFCEGATIVTHLILRAFAYNRNDVKAIGAGLAMIEVVHIVAGCEDEVVALFAVNG